MLKTSCGLINIIKMSIVHKNIQQETGGGGGGLTSHENHKWLFTGFLRNTVQHPLERERSVKPSVKYIDDLKT